MYVCMYVCMYVYMYMHTNMNMCIYIWQGRRLLGTQYARGGGWLWRNSAALKPRSETIEKRIEIGVLLPNNQRQLRTLHI